VQVKTGKRNVAIFDRQLQIMGSVGKTQKENELNQSIKSCRPNESLSGV